MHFHEVKDTQFKGQFGGILPVDTKQLTEEGEFEGYASVYSNVDLGGDIVKPGAFDDSLRNVRPATKVKMLLHHDTRELCGTWVEMKSDATGLFVKGKLLLSTQRGRETYELMKVGALDAMSIGYRATEDAWDSKAGVRTIIKALLLEVSLVTFPMNASATVSGVKNGVDIKTTREFEKFLRDEGGFSNQAAKAIASGGFKALQLRDEGGTDQGEISALHKLAEMFAAK